MTRRLKISITLFLKRDVFWIPNKFSIFSILSFQKLNGFHGNFNEVKILLKFSPKILPWQDCKNQFHLNVPIDEKSEFGLLQFQDQTFWIF